jgi:hypothetical protein
VHRLAGPLGGLDQAAEQAEVGEGGEIESACPPR